MKRKRWESKTKFEVVLAGLKGNQSISEICNCYGNIINGGMNFLKKEHVFLNEVVWMEKMND